MSPQQILKTGLVCFCSETLNCYLYHIENNDLGGNNKARGSRFVSFYAFGG